MSKQTENSNSFYELIKTLFYAITAVLFRSILFEPFNIPSGQ